MRSWKPLEEWPVLWTEETKDSLSKILQERQVENREGEDIIRWGFQGNGEFNVKTTYQIMQDSGPHPIRTIWSKIWSKSLWPKISTFLWLVANKRILTWDRLLKKGFTGPSRCSLCYDSEETQDHLLRKCNFTMQFWDQGATNFQRTDLQRDNVVATIELWRANPFNNASLTELGKFSQVSLCGMYGKKGNQRIFKDKALTKNQLWELINRNMTESIATS
jgi:hypothetical protein